MPGTISRHPERLLQALVLGAMALAILAVILGPLHRLPLWMPRDENEGWNAFQALAALSGAVLYPPFDAFVTNNYPPLSFYIVGALGRVLGDNIVAGRVIALLSELAVAGNIYLLARALHTERFFALFSSLVFLLYIGANAQIYVAMDDPEWLGRAFVTGGAVLFLRARRVSHPAGPLLLSGLLCVAGALVKHNLVVLPLALFTWALWNDRRQLLPWALISLALAVVSVLLIAHVYGAIFLQDVLEHKRGLSAHKLAGDSLRLLTPMTPLLAYGLLLGLLAWREASTRFVVTYAVVGGGIGLFFLAGIGIDVNALFDLIIALSLAAGLFAARLVPMLTAEYRRFAPAAITAVMAALFVPQSVQAALAGLDLIRQDRAELGRYHEFIAAIAAAQGPVACEQPSLCYWAGKPFEIDFSNYGKKLRAGTVGPEFLGTRLDTGYYAYIQTTGHPAAERNNTRRYLGNEFSRRLDEHYMAVRQLDEHYLLAPR
ncbi:MAG TPA: glycosyltransferase family 39 protein [Steroidobacteraceae bacterium]